MLSEKHWDTLYSLLFAAHEECREQNDDIYQSKIGVIIDHMIENKPYLLRK